MATSNHERVGRALELLRTGLRPFVERELRARYGDGWVAQAAQALRQAPASGSADLTIRDGEPHLDAQALLSLTWFQWDEVFAAVLGRAERSLVSELREVRNRWAHQEPFSTDDAYRALDSAQRLLTAVSAEEASEIDRQKQELLRLRFEEQARRERRKAAVTPVEGQPAAGLRPWREVVTPHPDVASGHYQQAEFMADLGQVHRGQGSDEYRDPTEFFRRTFLTDGLRHLLLGALRRLTGADGDPVVELQTNFGGGKTHSMLALYHLVSGRAADELPGIEPVLVEAGLERPPAARRAVLVGTALSPGQPHRKPDGTVVNTLWGELAWQLLGREGYDLVAQADRAGVSPGSENLRLLFETAAPCLVLIDEWLAFVRQLYRVEGLPAGSFDANLSFAQALTEAARQAPRTLVVASIPSSDIEIGGEAGREALVRLRNVFARVESSWRPASAEEGFEIVRRRLFQPLEARLAPARDAVVRAFGDLYRSQASEFPAGCREADYERRLKAAYPIHPELFDRLYTDWSALDTFQRTRGVLRLMAAVIHALWERQDASLLILPSTVPIDDPAVQFELTRYLEDPWDAVIARDVDGPHSLPLQLDRANPNFGRYSACRRVARTLYLGSAPTLHSANRGLDDRSIKLGCAQPGESVAIFGDALRRLTDQATHLYVDGKRYWFSTQPSVARLAQDRAAQLEQDTVWEELRRRLRADRQRGEFAAVYAAPPSSAEVPDEPRGPAGGCCLVVLGPEHPHTGKQVDSPARQAAAAILESRGTAPRLRKNLLLFLAPDRARLAELEQAVRAFLAWKSIDEEQEPLNLDAFQRHQARTRRGQADETVNARILETYVWLLAPGQPDPHGPVEWEELRLQGPDPLAVRASRRLRNDELLITQFSATRLRLELDRWLWRDRDHLPLDQLWEYFATYLYLPRLRDSTVLLEAVRQGVASPTWEQDAFAFAEGYDEARARYLGLVAGQQAAVTLSGGLLVKPAAARRQIDAEEERRRSTRGDGHVGEPATDPGAARPVPAQAIQPPGIPPSTTVGTPTVTLTPRYRRFHGSVGLDPVRLTRDAGTIVEEVVQHLSGLPSAKVEVTIEIRAEVPEGVPDRVVQIVTENCHALRFTSYGFEEE